jgi:hypothetical protein
MPSLFRTRNPSQDIHQQEMRTAPPLPLPAVIPTHGMAPEVVAAQIEQRRQRERAAEAQTHPASTLADEAVRCLRALLVAADDQGAGRPLSPTANQALGDLARLLKVAEARGVGLSSDWSVRPG